MGGLFYTKERKNELAALQKDPMISQKPLTMMLGLAMLDALGEMQNTLQAISDTLPMVAHPPSMAGRQRDIHVKRGEVYYADLDGGIGSEQKGHRPVAIMQNDAGNAYSPTVIVVPATSRAKNALSTHAPIHGETGLDCRTIFMAEQIQTIDKGRLGRFVCRLKEETMIGIEEAARISLGIENT